MQASNWPKFRDQSTDPSKWQQFQPKIKQSLINFQKRLISVRQYCQISRKALSAPYDVIEKDREHQNNPRSESGNHKNLVGLLMSPNVNFKVLEERDSKRAADMTDAGKRVISTIAYAWDYYVRLIQGRNNEKQGGKGGQGELVGVYTPENVRAAADRIEDMLKQMESLRYHWQNFTKEVRSSQEQEHKEIEQQEVFIKLLTNILNSQTEKVLEARKHLQMFPGDPVEIGGTDEEQESEGLDVRGIEQPKERRSVKEVMDVDGYFKKKIARLQAGEAKVGDAISRCQDKRRFNAAAFRYFMDTQCER